MLLKESGEPILNGFAVGLGVLLGVLVLLIALNIHLGGWNEASTDKPTVVARSIER